MSTLRQSGLYDPPPFNLSNIQRVLREAQPRQYALKLDLTNGLYHIPVAPGARGFFGIKCGESYLRFRKLPAGWGGSPFIMQRCMEDIFKRLGERFNFTAYVYLDEGPGLRLGLRGWEAS